MCAAGPEQMMIDASFALAQEPAWSPWRDNALAIGGEAHLLAGSLDQAAALFRESSDLGGCELQYRFTRRQRVRARAAWRWIAVDGWRQASIWSSRSTKSTSIGLHDYATCILAFAAAARLAVHNGDLE